MKTLMTMVVGLERMRMVCGRGCRYMDIERNEGGAC